MSQPRLSTDYNVFGYDPGGFIAHLAALFYGPDWRPRYLGSRPFYVGVAQPPRYGAPAIHQKAYLPKDFVVCLPPHYYGVPLPPYLPSPTQFHPDFAAVLEGLQCVALMDKSEVYSVLIAYDHDTVAMQFEMLTNEPYASVCGRLQVNSELVQLEYRILGDGVFSESFRPLTMELDWCRAMANVCRVKKEYGEVTIHILQISEPKQKGRCGRITGTCLDAGRRLSSSTPQIKTYPFIYPTIGDLFDQLNVQDCVLESYPDEGNFWDADLLEVLNRATIDYIDELILISPRSLHLATGIPAWRVILLYREAIEMIRVFHFSMDDDINDIRQMRRDARRRK